MVTGLVVCAVVFGTRALRLAAPRRASAATAPVRGRTETFGAGGTPTRTVGGETARIEPSILEPSIVDRSRIDPAPVRRVAGTPARPDDERGSLVVRKNLLSETRANTRTAWSGHVTQPAGRRPSVFAAVTPAGGGIARGGPARVAMDWRALIALPGVTFAAEEITDASSGTSAFARATSLRTHSDLQVTVDLDSAAGVPGLTLFAQHKTKTGRDGSARAAMVQSVSNIDADDFRSFGEVWVEQRLATDRVRIKAGRIDFNSEFAATDHGGAFLNASMGYSPSIAAAPTFPLPTTGINLFVSPLAQTTIALGVFNGLDGAPAPSGGSSRFQIAQISQRWSLGADRPGRVGVGAWRHTGLFLGTVSSNDDASADPASTDPGLTDPEPDVQGTHGWYSTLDQRLWQGAPRANESERATISAFAQFGMADERVQTIHAHNGGGLTLAGLSANRPSDVIGVGVTRATWREGSELITELFYQLPVTSYLSLVADFQRIARHETGRVGQFGNVTTLRTIVSF